jgi:hypothetical protein
MVRQLRQYIQDILGGSGLHTATAVAAGTQSTTGFGTGGYPVGAPATLTTPGTYYPLNSITLPAGTYALLGIVEGGAIPLLVFSTASGSSVSIPGVTTVQGGGTGANAAGAIAVAAVVTLAAPATIFLNAESSSFAVSCWGGIYATTIS